MSIYLLVAATVAGLKKENQFYYFEEKQYFTFFSALLLGCTALVSMIVSRLHQKIDPSLKLLNFWFISSLGFFYLCLDEYFMIHEGMDRAILKSFGQDPHLANFDGWILFGLGIIGWGVVYKLRIQVLRYRDFLFLFIAAALFFGGMVFSDQIFSHEYPFGIIEEAFKILGVTFFFMGYLSVLFNLQDQLLLDATQKNTG